MSQLLESRWSETKEALLEGLQGTKRSVMATTLENTRKYLAESATAGATSAGNVATLNRVILPVIRRVMPTVIANELVGVQPLTGPVGQIHTLRVRYADTFSGSTGGSTTAGEEALSPFKIAEGYSGVSPGKADATAAKEGVAGNKLNIQILKQTVEAKTRKLSARWTFEAAQDAQAQQGIDIEAEIMAALAQEITAEIDQEVLRSLATLAGTQNQIAYDQALQSATTSAFARTTEGTFEAPTNTKFVGTLNSAMKIYVNTYAETDTVLVGYKGSSESDAAAFYCPYIPLMSSGVVLDPSTFEPVVSFMTRYGYVELTNTASSLGNAADYLGTVTVANSSFT